MNHYVWIELFNSLIVSIMFYIADVLDSTPEIDTLVLDTKNPKVKANLTEIVEGSAVTVNCTVPLLLVVSHPTFEFTFRNKTQGVISNRKFGVHNFLCGTIFHFQLFCVQQST